MNALIERDNIIGQRRTGRHKRFVVYKHDYPDIVYKGPYNIDGSDQAYNNLFYRDEILRQWNAKQVIYMNEIVEFDSLFYTDKNDNKVFAIVYPNLRGEVPQSSEENVESWEPHHTYNISTDSNTCDKLSNMTTPEKYITKELIRSLLLLYILKTGDMGAFNIIICNDEATIIDYEDSKTHEPKEDNIFFFFSREPAKNFRDRVHIVEYFIELIDELRELDLSVIDTNYMSKSEAKNRYNDMINRVGSFIKPPISQMVKKYRNTKTTQGHSDSLIKSALQKNIRRGNVVQSVACAFELQRFQLIDAYDIVHNLYNRLAIIACEDVTIANLGVQAYICGWNKMFVRDGNLNWINNSTLDINDRYNNARLAAIVQYLAKMKKTRIGSHVWRSYTIKRDTLAEYGYEVEPLDIDMSATEEDLKDFKSRRVPYLQISDFNIENGSFALCCVIIHNRLKNRDFNAIAWIDYFRKSFVLTKPVVKVNKRNGRMRCDIILWNIFNQFVSNEIIVPIMEMYFHISESKGLDDRKIPLVTLAIRILMRNDDEEIMVESNLDKVSYIIDKQTKKWENMKRFDEYIDGKVNIKIESYMVDKHTGRRGTMTNLRRQFVDEGALVENQDEDYLIPDMKEIYEI